VWSTALLIRLGKFGGFGSRHLMAMGETSMEKK